MTGIRLEEIEKRLGTELRDIVEEWGDMLAVLTFKENQRGGDPIAQTTEGQAVFPDKFRGGDDIREDDTWLCKVAEKGSGAAFAAPILKLDPSFYFDLVPTQVHRLVEVALADHRDALEPLFRDAVEAHGDEEIKRRFAHLQGENERLLEERDALMSDKEAGETRLRELEHEVRTLRAHIAERGDGNGEKGGEAVGDGIVQPVVQATPAGDGWVALDAPPGQARVLRVEEDALESEAFEAERYFGHVSPSRRVLFLKPHKRGNLPCVHRRVQIPGLSTLMAFDGAEELEAEYVGRHGGYMIRLS